MIRLLLALLLFIAACDTTGQPRELPSPTFMASTLFPELTGPSSSSQPESNEFEDRIQQLMNSQSDDDPGSAPTRSVHLVPLGASLAGEIPNDPDQWRWSRQNNLTLISFTPAGQDAPQLLILTKDYPISASHAPSRALKTFIGDVDPTLSAPFNPSALLEQANLGQLPLGHLADPSGQISIDDLLDHFVGATTLTGGRGLGYRSHRDTFSGWRFIGQNASEVFLRFSTSRGNWGPQPTLPQGLDPNTLQSILDSAADNSLPSSPTNLILDLSSSQESLGQLFSNYQSSESSTPADPNPSRVVSRGPDPSRSPQQPTRQSNLYLGQAEISPSRGIYLAILCTSQPTCPLATEIVHFLDRLRPADAPPSGRRVDLTEHANDLGLHLQ